MQNPLLIDIAGPAVTPTASESPSPKDLSVRPAPLPIFILFATLLALPGCALFSDAPHYRGIAVSQHDLNELSPGTSSQADAQALLGPPTAHEQFQDNNWLYVSQITKMRIGATEGVKQQHVVELSFDNNGILQKITEKDLRDGVVVAMDTEQTPVPGGKAGFFQQLIGGVGSYNPGILGGGGAQDTSGAGAGGLGGGGFGGGSGGSNIGGAGSNGL
jgi:outer membrane protein assembly factor BamE (lipoprotein component of BamABCDE complex)